MERICFDLHTYELFEPVKLFTEAIVVMFAMVDLDEAMWNIVPLECMLMLCSNNPSSSDKCKNHFHSNND